jgi:carbonic anhydrase
MTTNGKSFGSQYLCRRDFLGASLGAYAIAPFGRLSLVQLATGLSGSLTKEQRDSMTPSQIIDELKKGNERFRSGRMTSRN